MKLHIHCRTDVPWGAMRLDDFRAQVQDININGGPPERVSTGDVIQLWERAYGLSFFGYRETLKRVCYASIREWCDAAKVTYTRGVWSGAHGDIVVPVDDDDIILPDVLRVLSYFEDDSSIDLVVWNRVTVHHGRQQEAEKVTHYLDTNNWAIRGSFLESFPVGERLGIVLKHQLANKWIQKRYGIKKGTSSAISPTYFQDNKGKRFDGCPQVLYVPQTWSLYFRHSASISWLAVQKDIEHVRSKPLHPLFDMTIYECVMRERGAA